MFTVEQLKAYIGPGGEIGTDEETVLEEMEIRTVALVNEATGRFFGDTEPVTYKLDGPGGVVIHFGPDVASIEEVWIRSSVSSDWVQLDADQYECDAAYPKILIRVDGSEWPIGEALVRLEAFRGFTTTPAPGPIQQLVLDLVNWQYRAGRKLALEDLGSPDVGRVKGWDRVISLYRGPLYG